MSSPLSSSNIILPPYSGPSIPPTKPRGRFFAPQLSYNGILRLYKRGQRPKFPSTNSRCARFRLRKATPSPASSLAITMARSLCFERELSVALLSARKQLRLCRSALRHCRRTGSNANHIHPLIQLYRVHIQSLKEMLKFRIAGRQFTSCVLQRIERLDKTLDTSQQHLTKLSCHLLHYLPP